MWYRTKLAQFGGGVIKTPTATEPNNNSSDIKDAGDSLKKALTALGQHADYMYPELMELINNLNLNADEIASDTNKLEALFDILVNRSHSNIPKDDDHSAGFEAMEARRHSPFHPNPEEESMENKLEATRHQTTNVPTMNDVEKTQGFMSIHGMPQYARGKQSPLMMNTELPSNRTLY